MTTDFVAQDGDKLAYPSFIIIINVKKLNSLKRLVRMSQWLCLTTKTAKIKKVILLISTSP